MNKRNAMKNAMYAGSFFILYTILQFINRSFFIKYLNVDYLGLNGVLTSLVGMMAVADLGISSAINFSLYAPIKEKNSDLIQSLLLLYRKIYLIIATVVLLTSFILSFFLQDFVDLESKINIYIPFFLLTLNAAVSYTMAASRSLIIANQKDRIASMSDFLGNTFVVITQILVLIFTQNYILYLLLRVIGTLGSNIYITYRARNLIPGYKVKEFIPIKIPKETISELIQNVSGNFFLRLGGIVVVGSDNLLISKFVGITSVGIYSNYLLIIQTLQSLIQQMFNAIVSTIGNFALTSTDDEGEVMYHRMQFLNFVIILGVAIGLESFISTFIYYWVGNKFIFSTVTTQLLIISFFFMNYNITSWNFTAAYGLAGHMRSVSISEMLLNLVFSIMLAKYTHLGINAIILGTILSTILTVGWMNAYVIFKYGFNRSVKSYLVNYLKDIIIFVFLMLISYFLKKQFTNINLILQSISIFVVLLICMLLLVYFVYRKNDEFKYWKCQVLWILKR
ncbi:hypothetical protein NB814_09835 [Latilactobacillus curvatus]|uniref:lipopolysaccharide biosynthesis protein n=1 Tax=Latilactobacillus curvatus TaxID=28038 RepID=UPI00202E2027|nr:hypothetical protein [Latilactobacillus curvatus]MCM0725992.1 hypothetical protein [Latilactobacillus curvatus]